MTHYRRFVAGLVLGFLFAVSIYATAFCLNLGVPTQSSKWCFEITRRKCAIAAGLQPPRLLLVGGSGTLFGISAADIQQQSGYSTVNLGTHAVLGANYILHQARQIAQPGDTVLLILEYELYTRAGLDPVMADQGFVDYVLARDPAYIPTLPLSEKCNLFMLTSTQRLKKGLKNLAKTDSPASQVGVYDFRFINEWGDQTHNEATNRPPNAQVNILKEDSILALGLPKHPAGFVSIEAFCKWAQSNNIRVLATFPNLCDKPQYHTAVARQTADRIREFYEGIGVPVLGDYSDSTLPPESFFDTMYHLTREASRVRTEKLLTALGPYLRRSAETTPVAIGNFRLTAHANSAGSNP